MPLFANSLTNPYILVSAIVAGYGLARAFSHAYFDKVYERRMLARQTVVTPMKDRVGKDLDVIWKNRFNNHP